MFKKFLICMFYIACNTNAMELQQWVQDATTIPVNSMKGMDFEVPITDTTTVQQVKQFLATDSGVPVAHQLLYPVQPVRWTFGLLKTIDKTPLVDDAVVKDVMNWYNARSLQLCIRLNRVASK